MATLKVVTYPNPILAKKAESVLEVNPQIVTLIRNMIQTMHAEGGVGIAAPQVGVLKRIFIANPNATPGEEVAFINPVIFKATGEQIGLEGCLSLPDVSGEVRRAKTIEFEFLDLNGKKKQGKATDFLARIFQHELDHLDGKLLIDRVDFDQRQEILSSYQRL